MGAAAAPRDPRSNPGRPSAGSRAAVAAAVFLALVLALNASTQWQKRGVPTRAATPTSGRREAAAINTAAVDMQHMVVTPAARPQYGCKRMLWMAGLQAKAADGSEAHYITSASSYLRYYASALRSARERAPALLPVLVVLNDMPQDVIDWVEAQGGLVIHHELSFAARMEATNDPWLRENLTKQLMASYARLDVPAIMEKVIAALPAYQRRWQQTDAGAGAAAVPAEVDLETVLWTDPDVLFRHEIDSCSLPMPRLLSIGPELRPGTVINCGVMVFNVKAYAAMLPAMLEFADSRKWVLLHDQELVELFFKSNEAARFREPWHRLTALPDAYNYKAYWGEPDAGWQGMFTHQVGDVAIVHTHGPKPEMSLCVIEYLQHNVKKKLGWEPKHVIHRKNEIVEHCGIQVALYLDELLQIMAGAFKADEGAMYRWVLREQDRLCPGACWVRVSSKGEWGHAGADED